MLTNKNAVTKRHQLYVLSWVYGLDRYILLFLVKTSHKPTKSIWYSYEEFVTNSIVIFYYT